MREHSKAKANKQEGDNRTVIDRAVSTLTDWTQRFLGLPTAAERSAAGDANGGAHSTFEDPRFHGAATTQGLPYVWARDSFPRLRLSDGREMPGTIDFHEWRYGRPEWDLSNTQV